MNSVLIIASVATLAPVAAAEPGADFVADIQPIFARHCIPCHGPDEQKSSFRLDVREVAFKGGDTYGVAIVPGDSAGSPLLRYVSGRHEELTMPPKGPLLSPREAGLLRAWIDLGAPWPDSATATVVHPGDHHWAFQPLERPGVPDALADASGNVTPIDAFIGRDLQRNGLAFSPEADRRTLIRRLHFNLHGLPPCPEEVDAFECDPDPLAYEKLVDALLASPRYGERWARHWLDIVAFGETHGFEVNTPRDNAWPYRDYVIRALNEDKPYPEFIRDQLAGDLTGADAATGFMVAKAALLPGQVGRDEESIRLARQDELNDMVLGAGSAFLALTVSCARCHDHKFDPISQADYYAMQGIFSGVRHGERPWRTTEDEATTRKSASLSLELARVERQLSPFEPPARPEAGAAVETHPALNEECFAPVDADFVRFTIYHANLHPTLGLIEPCLDELEVFTGGAEPRNVALASAGARATASGSTTSARHKLEHLHDGQYGNDRSWMSSEAGRGWVQIEFAARETISRIVWSRDRQGHFSDRLPTHYVIESGLRNGSEIEWKPIAGTGPIRPPVHPRLTVERFEPTDAKRLRLTVFETTGLAPCVDELEVFTAGEPPRNVALAATGARATASGPPPDSALHKLEHIHDGEYGNSHSWRSGEDGQGWVEIEFPEAVRIDRVLWSRDREGKFTDRLPVRYEIAVAGEAGHWRVVASSVDRQPYVPGAEIHPIYETHIADEQRRERLEGLLAERRRIATELGRLQIAPMIYAGRFEAEPQTVWRLHRGDPMQRREEIAPAALSRIGPPFHLAPDASEPQRRLALAAWLADPKNPLPARVLVNRLWHHHFGEGIVSTPSDFGINGARPTHPGLLDWLATEFIAQGWSLKKMHRLICLSRTFRQSSRPDPVALAVDAETRLLWRFPPRRLEAEVIRDAMLAAAGTLDLGMGGPGFSAFKPNDNYVRVYEPKEVFGPAEWRRMVYMTKVRMEQDGTFGALDCPDAGQEQPRRPRSTTPIQALNLFNSTFVGQQAALMAERLERQAGARPPAQVRLGFQLAFARTPDAEEETLGVEFINEHGTAQFCRVLLNANEFVHLP
ncbi:MAG: PSD1 domain-containing protein [Verrucomicrobiae bacterium]|nr:PSD1 domain-containing protein [Verrucomicrobiae bacterium]